MAIFSFEYWTVRTSTAPQNRNNYGKRFLFTELFRSKTLKYNGWCFKEAQITSIHICIDRIVRLLERLFTYSLTKNGFDWTLSSNTKRSVFAVAVLMVGWNRDFQLMFCGILVLRIRLSDVPQDIHYSR